MTQDLNARYFLREIMLIQFFYAYISTEDVALFFSPVRHIPRDLPNGNSHNFYTPREMIELKQQNVFC